MKHYNLRTGDIVLCKNKPLEQTNAYLVVYNTQYGFGLWCLGCGEALGFYGDDIERMKKDLLNKNFLDIQFVVPKEAISAYFNNNYQLELPVKPHKGSKEMELSIDIDDNSTYSICPHVMGDTIPRCINLVDKKYCRNKVCK